MHISNARAQKVMSSQKTICHLWGKRVHDCSKYLKTINSQLFWQNSRLLLNELAEVYLSYELPLLSNIF